MNQFISQSFIKSVSQSVIQFITQTTNQPFIQITHQPFSHTTDQLFSRLCSLSFIQTDNNLIKVKLWKQNDNQAVWFKTIQ